MVSNVHPSPKIWSENHVCSSFMCTVSVSAEQINCEINVELDRCGTHQRTGWFLVSLVIFETLSRIRWNVCREKEHFRSHAKESE